MDRVHVALGDRSYDVVVHEGAFEGLGAAVHGVVGPARIVVVTDDIVAPLWLDAAVAALHAAGLSVQTLVVPHGEHRKTLQTWATLLDGLLERGVDRKTVVAALGGGVLGDLTGFAAAVALRGLRWIQIPTTLLAMVDSSVGGKTAFNHPRGKNLVGAFHQPVLVWAGLRTLTTLDPRQVRAGWGEILKAALLGADGLAEQLDAGEVATEQAVQHAILSSVALKARVVEEDEREGGRRAILNLGHTLGHGLEGALGYGTLLHGEAVGLGLLGESAWARRTGLLDDPALPERIRGWCASVGLPTSTPAVAAGEVVRWMNHDKKVADEHVTLPVVRSLGACSLVQRPRSVFAELADEAP